MEYSVSQLVRKTMDVRKSIAKCRQDEQGWLNYSEDIAKELSQKVIEDFHAHLELRNISSDSIECKVASYVLHDPLQKGEEVLPFNSTQGHPLRVGDTVIGITILSVDGIKYSSNWFGLMEDYAPAKGFGDEYSCSVVVQIGEPIKEKDLHILGESSSQE